MNSRPSQRGTSKAAHDRAVESITRPYGIARIEAYPGLQLQHPGGVRELDAVALCHECGNLLLHSCVYQQQQGHAIATTGLLEQAPFVLCERCAIEGHPAALTPGDGVEEL
jgi:hypothetical protein